MEITEVLQLCIQHGKDSLRNKTGTVCRDIKLYENSETSTSFSIPYQKGRIFYFESCRCLKNVCEFHMHDLSTGKTNVYLLELHFSVWPDWASLGEFQLSEERISFEHARMQVQLRNAVEDIHLDCINESYVFRVRIYGFGTQKDFFPYTTISSLCSDMSKAVGEVCGKAIVHRNDICGNQVQNCVKRSEHPNISFLESSQPVINPELSGAALPHGKIAKCNIPFDVVSGLRDTVLAIPILSENL